MVHAARAPSSVALRISPSPVQSPAACTATLGRAATSFSYSSVFGSKVPAMTTLSAASRRLVPPYGVKSTPSSSILLTEARTCTATPRVEPVHMFGLAFVAQFRRDRLIGLEHRHQPAACGDEFGEFQRDQVGADDDDAMAERHPRLGRRTNGRGPDQPLSPAAEPLTQRPPG